jgi:hypothetical protein
MSTDPSDLRSEVEDLKTAMAVQEATQAGQAATDAATHAGTWSTFVVGGAALSVGMFLALAMVGASRK